jgi:nucleotide-binding universal stress UspA family protein
MFKTVLFPVDQSRDAREAAETVAALVKLCDSKLMILSVEESEDTDPPHLTTDAIDQLLESARSMFEEWGIAAQTMHRTGKVAFCICDVADEIGADIIVMGCRGIGLTDEGAQDSVSNRVINLSPCPVLIVP